MNNTDWKNLFSSTILQRGKNYFKEGAVDDLLCNGGEVTATVWGTEEYNVEIWMNGSEVVEMSCSCPYAEDGTPCKHMAAVLFAWTSLPNGINTASKIEPQMPLEEAIRCLSVDTLQKLLLKQAQDNRTLEETIRMYATGTVNESQKKAWNRELKALQRKYEGVAEGYGDFDEYFEYFAELVEILHTRMETLIELNMLRDAVNLLRTVYSFALDCSNPYEMNDGCDVVLCCREYFEHIVNIADPAYTSELYERCLHECGGQISDQNDFLWQDTLLNAFNDTDYIQRNLILVEEALGKASHGELECDVVYLVQTKVRFMRALGMNESEVVAFRRQYHHYGPIRQSEIQDALVQGDVNEAVRLLCEYKQTTEQRSYTRQQIMEKLISLYEQLQDQTAYQQELQEYIFGVPQRDLVYVKKLKTALTENEWQEILPRILQAETLEYLRHELMAQEGMYRVLLNELEGEIDLQGLQKYEELLKPHFPEEIRDVFFAYLRRAMDSACHRSVYEQLVARLKRMKTYPGGKEMADQLAAEWRWVYKRRSALMDEMRRAGFA